MTELLWLLLPVAAASGWVAARRTALRANASSARSALSSEYFKGINYLLNEQPDKAIEVFIRVLEVDSETVETHLALGNLYRRRGEVDRAIRIHQNLVARTTIDDEQRYEALLELGQDYLSAGLLDRAENLFRELVDAGRFKVQALRQLIDIYEQEKDWDEAAEAARALEQATGSQLGNVISQYLCEQAEQAREAGKPQEALRTARRARDAYAGCARASIIEGDLLCAQGDLAGALEAYERVETQDADYVPEVVERVRGCHERLGDAAGSRAYLTRVLARHGGMTAALALAEVTSREAGEERAAAFLLEQLKQRPSLRGFERLLELTVPGSPAPGRNDPLPGSLPGSPEVERDKWFVLRDLTASMLKERPVYKCQRCGFPARLLHWRCPGCKHWASVRPIHGVEGE